jgi:putative ABC transport system permease protein
MFRFYVRLTVKNLFRHKRRTILTALAIMVGILFYIGFDSIITGQDHDAIKNMLDLEVAHFQIWADAPEEKDNISLKHLLPDGNGLANRVSRISGVTGAAPRLLFPATLINGFDELPVIGIGVSPKLDATVFTIPDFVKGRWVKSNEFGVVIGEKIANLLEIKLGDQITLRTQTRQNTFQALDLEVVGLVNSSDPIINETQIFLPLDTTQKILNTGTAVTMVAVKTVSYDHLENVIQKTKQIQDADYKFKIKTWREAAAALIADIMLHRQFGAIFMFLVFVIATIGVVNSILLSSLERVREIGLLKAMGMTEGDITRLFCYEALGLGFIGGLIGVILAVVLNIYLVNVGIDYEAMFGNMNVGFPISKMHGAWNWGVILWAFIFGLLVCLLASFLPARKAARIDPANSLRKV